MQKNKHIVLITPGFPENETDSTCIPTLRIFAKALSETVGYEVSVVSLHYPKKKDFYWWHGIPVYAMGSSSLYAKLIFWRKVNQILKKIHQEKPITVLHSFWLGECALIGYWFSKKNQIKHLTTLMGQDALKGNSYARLLPLKKMQFVTISKIQQQLFYKNYNINSEMIECGISAEDFNHPIAKNIDLIEVGFLTKLKNQSLFIDVVQQLNQTQPIKAVIIGDGILKLELQKKISELELDDVIEMKGQLDYEETLKYIAQSKILLHPTSYEGFGLVFAEALHSQTMIVSKNVGGAIASENWVIANSAAEMVKACHTLLSKSFSEEKRSFFIEEKIQQYLPLYDE